MPDTDGGDIPGGNGNLVPDGSNGADTPNTGYLTVDGSSNPDSSALSSNMLVLGVMSMIILVAITSLVIITRKHNIKFIFNRSKYASRGLIALALLVSVLSFIGLKDLNNSYNLASADDSSQQAEQGDTLAISTSDAKLDITLEDDPVYAYTKDTVTVSSPTEAGYTLSAYIDGNTKDLVNTTNSSLSSSEAESAKIVGLSTMSSQALVDNSWGIALTEPTSKDSTVFHGLPTNEDEALTLNVKGAATEANDTTDVYLGAYVVPGLPTGTYSGVTINYVAVANVVTDDITVKYHGNGLYFDEGQTKDENTVVYGNSCGMMYVGANCKKAYTTEEPAEIVKTSNLNDDGTKEGPYPQTPADESPYVINQVVTVPNAEKLRIEIDYGLSSGDYVYIIQGAWDGQSGPENYKEIGNYSDNISDQQTFDFDGDTITFVMVTGNNELAEGYDYGFYAKVYPMYTEKPTDIETTETTICNFFKTSNLDDEGNQLAPYIGESGQDYAMDSISIPGAEKLKVEITYGLTAGTGAVEIIEGSLYNPGDYEVLSPQEENIAGTKTRIFDSNQLFFYYELSSNTGESLPENYDYGFYAKIYPVYNEETDDSTPERVCSIINKSGEYMNTFGENNSYWYSQIDNPSNPGSTLEFAGESGVKNYLNQNYNEYTGQTIDLYATPNYTIHFDANGGEGKMIDQTINYSGRLNANSFTRTNHIFNGWNTKADGSGEPYSNQQYVNRIAKPNETITLYAQWAPNDYIVHFDANGGEGEMMDQTIVYNTYTNLTTNSFTRTNYAFNGWNTEADGSGTNYSNTASVYNIVNRGETITLYAKWRAVSYTIYFDANGGSGEMENQTINIDTNSYLVNNIYMPPTNYHYFNGWNTKADGSGASYTNQAEVYNLANGGETITLYAQWGTIYNVHFDANGGSGEMENQTINTDISTNLINNSFIAPTNYVFNGWNTEADGSGASYTNQAEVYNLANGGETITLYAQWLAPYTIHFDANGGSGEMENQIISSNTNAELIGNTFDAPANYYFVNWNTKADGSGDTYINQAEVYNLTDGGENISLYAQWADRPIGNIFYDANGNNVEGFMGIQSKDDDGNAITSGSTVTLYAPNFNRAGYGFAGWSDVPNYDTNSNAHFYGPNETITAPEDIATNGLILYAVWVLSVGSLQSDATVTCNSLIQATANGTNTLSSLSALTDQRDGQTYAIAKLADGKCWMIENLRLEAEYTRGDTNKALSQGYGIGANYGSSSYGNFVGLADAENTNFSLTTAANSLYYSKTQEGTATMNVGEHNYPVYRIPRYNNINTNNMQQKGNYSTKENVFSYGNYYNFPATIANTAYITGNASSTSICPSGWHIPRGGNNWSANEYYTLNYAINAGSTNSNKFMSYPNNFLFSGFFYTDHASNRNGNGYYWSSTAYSEPYSPYASHTAYELRLNKSFIRLEETSTKSTGLSIRCIINNQ